MKFDPKTLQSWHHTNIKEVSIELIKSGCAGSSVHIKEGHLEHLTASMTIEAIVYYFDPSARDILRNAHITAVNGKWILKSDAILNRCGCGKSFGLKTGDAKQDKIQLLRSKLKKHSSHQ